MFLFILEFEKGTLTVSVRAYARPARKSSPTRVTDAWLVQTHVARFTADKLTCMLAANLIMPVLGYLVLLYFSENMD